MSDPRLNFKASAAHIYFNCYGSVRRSAGAERIESAYAREGTKAHDAAAHMLRNLPNRGITTGVDAEMQAAIDVYVEEVAGALQQAKESWKEASTKAPILLMVEETVNLKSYHPRLGAKLDALVLWPDKLQVFDYKHGAGVTVSAHNNKALMLYALGASEFLRDRGVKPPNEIEVVIVQPRAGHDAIRRSSFSLSDLYGFAFELEEVIRLCSLEDSACTVGEWCQFCDGAAKTVDGKTDICPAMLGQVAALLTGHGDPVRMNTDDLGLKLRACGYVGMLMRRIDDIALQRALSGETIPGYTLEDKRMNRAYREDVDVKMVLCTAFPDQDVTTSSPKSPAQLEAMFKKNKGLTEQLKGLLPTLLDTNRTPGKRLAEVKLHAPEAKDATFSGVIGGDF